MSKFKVGDEVRLISKHPLMCEYGGVNVRLSPWKYGHKTIVEKIDDEDRFVKTGDSDTWHYAKDWELVESCNPVSNKCRFELTASELFNHIKKHGMVRARTTENFQSVPAGTILWFNKSCCWEHGISSYDDSVDDKNKEFGYPFIYLYWWDNYEGNFIIEIESPKNELIKADMVEDIKNFDVAVLKKAEAEALNEIKNEQIAKAKEKFKQMHLRVVEAQKKVADANDELVKFKEELGALSKKK